ncbi:hypothetical protein [Aeromonas rivipollensis]|uniref:hypothetical protein n=1 Tax=Aeromonas rivipollensis TaxID=948519 RepID=UPI00372D4079
MSIGNRGLLCALAIVCGCILLGALMSSDFNNFISHPIVSGLLIALVASILIPKRIEAESKSALKKGFYDDMAFISQRYMKLAASIAVSAEKRSFMHSVAPAPIESGNESLSLSRLNQQLSLSSEQKNALIQVENAVSVINLNLSENIEKLKASLAKGHKGVHADNNMKAAFDSVCFVIFTLGKMVELRGRFELLNLPKEDYLSPALYILYPSDIKVRDRMLKWVLSDRQLIEIKAFEK